VKRGNDASLRTFRAAGFQVVGEDDTIIELLRRAEPHAPGK